MTETPTLQPDLHVLAERTKWFLSAEKVDALRTAATSAGPGLWLEIGTYCGKSTVHLAVAVRSVSAHLVTLDHHHGSEENQPGWEWHDPETVDSYTGLVDTLPFLGRTLHTAELEAMVSVLVASTQQVATWSSPLRFLFLDGNHTEEVARHDYVAFARHIEPGGALAVHDVFPDPRDGGHPPCSVMRRAMRTRAFEPLGERGLCTCCGGPPRWSSEWGRIRARPSSP